MSKTLFSRIIEGELPCVKLYEDTVCIVILDLNPNEKGHALVIAKSPYPTFSECPENELGHMMEVAKRCDRVMRDRLKADGSNILINNGKASGQEVPHLHIHVIPRFLGKPFTFKKQSYEDGEMEKMGALLAFDPE